MRNHYNKVIPLPKYRKGSKSFRGQIGRSFLKRIFMFRSLITFLWMGILWLFLFSIPIGHQGRTLYSIGHYYLVDTKFIHHTSNFIFSTGTKIKEFSQELFESALDKIESDKNK